MTATDLFSRDPTGLPEVTRPSLRRLRDGDRFALEISPVMKTIAGNELRMIAYNGSIPGPTLHVDQGSEIVVDVLNNGDVDTTVHWHGLRLDNQYDGVPVDTQAPIAIGETFRYRVKFPDPGFYWYHPHLREDYGQEMGMYGTIIVEPVEASYWPKVDRQLSITLDDLLIEDGLIAPFHPSGPTYTAMGRFGNVLLVNGEDHLTADVTLGDVVRLHLVNTANTRIFNVAIPNGRMKLIGGDSGRYEREMIVEEVLLAPSERAIVDVLFDRAGDAQLEHRTPESKSVLGTFAVRSSKCSFETLRVDPDLARRSSTLAPHRARTPDRMIAFRSSMLLSSTAQDGSSVLSYACPMHPEITSAEPSHCPKCGMRLIASSDSPREARIDRVTPVASASFAAAPVASALSAAARVASYACPMHPEITGTGRTQCPICGMWLTEVKTSIDPAATAGEDDTHLGGDGLEWEDLMPEINRQSTLENMHWRLTDLATGAENGDIFWTFTVGDQVKIRLVNELESDHPMHHPFHVHGAGRFLILARDGVPDDNLVWKDTVLIRAGETVDILLDVTNPRRRMAHCHIAEHIESGMMFSFDVLPAKAVS